MKTKTLHYDFTEHEVDFKNIFISYKCIFDGNSKLLDGTGVHLSVKKAHDLANYEFIERTIGSYRSFKGKIFNENFNKLNENNTVFNVHKISMFHKEQKTERKKYEDIYTENDSLLYIEVLDFNNNKILAPYDLFFWNDSTSFFGSGTIGSAIYTNFKEAKKRAIFESIEKATINNMWYLQKIEKIESFSLKAVINFIPKKLQYLINQANYKFYFVLKIVDGAIVSLAISEFKYKSKKYFSVGSSCNESVKQAITKSLLENIKTVIMLKQHIKQNKLEEITENNIRDYKDCYLYNNKEYHSKGIPFIEKVKKNLNSVLTNKFQSKAKISIEFIIKKYKFLFYHTEMIFDNKKFFFTKVFSIKLIPFSSNPNVLYLGSFNKYDLEDIYLKELHFFP